MFFDFLFVLSFLVWFFRWFPEEVLTLLFFLPLENGDFSILMKDTFLFTYMLSDLRLYNLSISYILILFRLTKIVHTQVFTTHEGTCNKLMIVKILVVCLDTLRRAFSYMSSSFYTSNFHVQKLVIFISY